MDINTVNVFYDIEYNNYKKKLMREIFIQVDTLFNIFENDFNENMIKLFILLKKDKLKNDNMKYLVYSLYDFIVELNNLEHIDQNEFLNLILKLIKVYLILMIVNLDIKEGNIDTEILQHINLEIINNKIVLCIEEMRKTNKIIDGLIKLNKYDIEDTKDQNKIRDSVITLGGLLAYDFFMYYSSTEIHRILYKKISHNSDTANQLNKLGILIIKYKRHFIKEYREKHRLYVDLYNEVIKGDISKYKVNISNGNFIKLIKELVTINNKI